MSANKETISGHGDRDGLVTKFNAAGSALIYSTHLGRGGGTAQAALER
ncbi:hypothetical protein [Rubrivivax gelatinosus]|nr:hypothetical protein [Rubrivivax gelatinosus]MBG6082443.1 hypothetical protein [Rubrivivax gelatinosus]